MKILKAYLLPLLAIAVIATSCKKEKTTPSTVQNPLDEYVLISESQATALDYTVKVYASEALFVGYNSILVQVKDNNTGEIINNPYVEFAPIMEMNSGMMHACPLEQPTYNPSLMVMEGTITFVMPSAMMGSWKLGLKLKNEAGTEEELKIPVDVMQKDEPQLYSFLSDVDNTTSYFVALVEPKTPGVGINDFEVVVYKRASMMSWPAEDGLKIEIDPEMPTMGHGSPNNVNPIEMGEGHYLGQVNFTMTGYWKVNMKIMDNSGAVMNSDKYFDITFN